MRLPHANLSAADFAERAGNNGEPVLEQLFDKLFKKALAHVENNTNEMHINEFLKCWSVGAAFLGQALHPVGLKKQSTLFAWNKVLCLRFFNVCEALISHCCISFVPQR